MQSSTGIRFFVFACALIVFLMAETGHGYTNAHGVRLKKYQASRWNYWKPHLRANSRPTYRYQIKPNPNPRWIIDGCPLVGAVYRCPTGYVPKRNYTVTETRVNATMTASWQQIPAMDLNIIKRNSASSFAAQINATWAQIEVKLDTWGEVAWMFFRVQSTSPQTPAYPTTGKDIYDALLHRSTKYTLSDVPKTRMSVGHYPCSPTKIVDNRAIKGPIKKLFYVNCTKFLTFKDLIPGETYAFFAVANRTRLHSFGTITAAVDTTAIKSGTFALADKTAPKWVSLTRGGSRAASTVYVKAIVSEAATVQCYAAWPSYYTSKPHVSTDDVQPIIQGVTEVEPPHPSLITAANRGTGSYTNIVGVGSIAATRDAAAATSLYCCSNEVEVPIAISDATAAAALQQGVFFDIFCAPKDDAGLIGGIRSIQDGAKDTTPPKFTAGPTVNLFTQYTTDNGATYHTDGKYISLNMTMNEAGKVWYYIAPADQYTRPAASYVGTVVDEGSGGIRAGFLTVNKYKYGWQGTEHSSNVKAGRCCYEATHAKFAVLPSLKYRVIVVGYDEGQDNTLFTGTGKRTIYTPNIQAFPTTEAVAPSGTNPAVGAVSGGGASGAEIIFRSGSGGTTTINLLRFGPCSSTSDPCTTFTADYASQTNMLMDTTSYHLQYKLSLPGYLTYRCAKYHAGLPEVSVAGVATPLIKVPNYKLIRNQLMKGLNITSVTNSTRRTSQVFSGKVTYDTFAAGKGLVKSVVLTGLLPGQTYFCLAEFETLEGYTSVKKSLFSGIMSGGTDIFTGTHANDARPYFLFKTPLATRPMGHKISMNKTATYSDVELNFQVNKRARVYYVIAPIRPAETQSYMRDTVQYKNVDKTKFPKMRTIWHKEFSHIQPVQGADLFNSATGRSVGALTDTAKYDTTGNLGFAGLLHASELNFAGMAPKNTAGTIECRESSETTGSGLPDLKVKCLPLVLSDGVTFTNKTYDEQVTAGLTHARVRVSGLDSAQAYRMFYVIEDLDTHVFTKTYQYTWNTTGTKMAPAPEIYPYVGNPKHSNLDGLTVTNIWTTRAVINVTASRPARIYWVAVRHDALPFTKASDIMYYGLLGRKRYVAPITGTVDEIDKDEQSKTGLAMTETASPHRYVYDAGVIDYFRDGGATSVAGETQFGVSPFLPRTARSHMEVGFLHKRFSTQMTMRGFSRGSTYTVYALPVDFDDELHLIGKIAMQNFTTMNGKSCMFSSSLGYTTNQVYTPVAIAISPPEINEDVFAKGFTWTWRLARNTSFPAPGDACFWTSYMQKPGDYAFVRKQLKAKARRVMNDKAPVSPFGLWYHWETLWNGVTLNVKNTTGAKDFFDEVTLQFPAIDTGARPFDVHQAESFCFDFQSGDLLVSNAIIPTLDTVAQASFCVIVKPVPGNAVFVTKAAGSVVPNNQLSELQIRNGEGVISLTLERETWAINKNKTFPQYIKYGTFAAAHLTPSGASAASFLSVRNDLAPFVQINNATLTITLKKSFLFYTQADIPVKVVVDGKLTRSTLGLPDTVATTFTIIAPLRNVQLYTYDNAGIQALTAPAKYSEQTTLAVASITDTMMRNGQATGAHILLRWQLTTVPASQDVFVPAAIEAMLNTLTVASTSSALNTHGFRMYKSDIIKSANCSAPTDGPNVIDCVLVPKYDFTLVEDETLQFSPIAAGVKAFRSGMIFTIVGANTLTIKKTAGHVKISPATVTEQQVRDGVFIEYEIVGDQFEAAPLAGISWSTFRAGATTETDIGTEPSGFLGMNSFTKGATAAECQDKVCAFPSCSCNTDETCPSTCTFTAARGCHNPACDATPFRGVGGMFKSQTLDGTNNAIVNSPLATKIKFFLHNPNYDCAQTEIVKISIADEAIRSTGFPLTTSNASLTITPTQGTLTMTFKSPRGLIAGVASESEIREGGLVISMQFSAGESFVSGADGINCIFNGWQPAQVSADQTAAFSQKRSELMSANTAIKISNSSRTVTITFAPGSTYNTKGTDVVKFDIFANTACFRSGQTPRFLQGGSASSVYPQFQITDGNPMITWGSPAEYTVGTYTAVVTEADVRAGLNLGIKLIGDQWVTTTSWLTSSVFKTAGVTSLPAVNAPVFAAGMASSTSVDLTKSKRDANDASLFTIVLAAQPTFDIAATETILISIPAATAGASSTSVNGNFEPAFGTAAGIILKVVAFSIQVQPSAYVTVVGQKFDVSVKVALSGWTAAASPDPSGARDAIALPSVSDATLVNGKRDNNKLVIDTVNRLSGVLNASGSGVVAFSTAFTTSLNCLSPCVTLGLRVPSLGETMWDERQASTLAGGVYPTLVDNWLITFPSPFTSVLTFTPVNLFVKVANGELPPAAGVFKLMATVYVGVATPFTRTVTINETSVNFGSISVNQTITTSTLARIEFALLSSTGSPVIVANKAVVTSYDIKLIPQGSPTYSLYDTPIPDQAFSIALSNVNASGKVVELVDNLTPCSSPTRKNYNNATVAATNMASFTVASAGLTFPITAQVCMDGVSIGGTLTIVGKPSASYVIKSDIVSTGEPASIAVIPGGVIAPGMSFFLTNSTCSLTFAAAFDAAIPAPLVSTATDGIFSFTLSEDLEYTKLYVCFKPAGAADYTLIASPAVTVQDPSSDQFETALEIEQYKTFYLQINSRRSFKSIKQIAFVKKNAAVPNCAALGRSSIPSSSRVLVAGDNPMGRLRWGDDLIRRFFSRFIGSAKNGLYSFTPLESTSAAMFCTRSSSSSIWRTVVLAGSSGDSVKIVAAPRFQLVASTYGMIGSELKISLTMKSTSKTSVFLTGARSCDAVPNSTTTSDMMTSGRFNGVTTGAVSGLSATSDGALNLIVPGSRLPKSPQSLVSVCVDVEGTGSYQPIRRESGGYTFEVRAGAPHHLVIETNGMTSCPLSAIQQRNYEVQSLSVRVEDANNLTVTTASGTLELVVSCSAFGAATDCSLLGRKSVYLSEYSGGVARFPKVYVSGVKFGGAFNLRATYSGLAADTLLRDTTCNGTLQFSRVGEASMGGSVVSGFVIPGATTGYAGANVIVRVDQDTFLSTLCTSDSLKTTLLQAFKNQAGVTANTAGLFTLASITSCTTSTVVLEVVPTYLPSTTTETWTFAVPSSLVTSTIAPSMALPTSFTLKRPAAVTFTSTVSSTTENTLAYISGFNVTFKLGADYKFVPIGDFGLVAPLFRDAVASTPANASNTSSTFLQNRIDMIPTSSIVRVDDQTVTMSILPNARYHIADTDVFQFFIPRGAIADYNRLEFAGNLTVTASNDAAKIIATVTPTEIVAGQSFTVSVTAQDAMGVVVPLSSRVVLATSTAINGNIMTLNQGSQSGSFNIQQAGNFTLSVSLADIALPAVAFNMQVAVDQSSLTATAKVPPPAQVGLGIPFAVVVAIKDKFGNAVADGTTVTLRSTGCATSQKASSMRRRLLQATVAPTAAPVTSAPTIVSSSFTATTSGTFASFQRLSLDSVCTASLTVVIGTKEYLTLSTSAASDLFAFLGSWPVTGLDVLPNRDAYISVAYIKNSQPVVGATVAFSTIVQADRIPSNYSRTAVTDATGVARMFFQYPAPGLYRFLATSGAVSVESANINVIAGPAVAISVTSPTPTAATTVAPRDIFTITVTGLDAAGYPALQSTNALSFSFKGPDNSTLLSQPSTTALAAGTAALSFSVSTSGTYVFTICLIGAASTTSGCATATVYANAPAADVSLDSGYTFTDCTLVSVTARFNASLAAFPNMFVAWNFLDQYGSSFALPGSWVVGNPINYDSANVLGSQLATLASTMAKSADLAAGIARAEFRPGQVGLTSTFKLSFSLYLTADGTPFTTSVTVEKDATVNIPQNIVVSRPAAVTTSATEPSLTIVDSEVYTQLSASYSYDGCSLPNAYWMCDEYSSTNSTTPTACKWTDEEGVSVPYVATSHKGTVLNLVPRSLPVPPAYRSYTFVVNDVRADPIDIQARTQSLRVTMDRQSFFGQRSVDAQNKVLYDVYCIRPPVDLNSKGALSYDPLATDESCEGCVVTWSYDGLTAIENFQSFITPKGLQATGDLSKVTQPIYGVKIYSIQTGTSSLKCSITKPGQEARTNSKTIQVTWFSQTVPDYSMRQVRPAGQSGPHNRNEEEGLRVIASLGDSSSNYFEIPVGYNTLTYTAVGKTAAGVQRTLTMTQNGAAVSSVTTSTGTLVSPAVLLASDIPVDIVLVNVSATLASTVQGVLPLTAFIPIDIAQPPAFVEGSFINAVYANGANIARLNVDAASTVLVGAPGTGTFTFTFATNIFRSIYTADTLSFRVVAVEQVLVANVLTPDAASSLAPINVLGGDGDYITPSSSAAYISVTNPTLTSSTFKFRLCARNKYIAESCRDLAISVRQGELNFEALEALITRDVTPVGAAGTLVDVGTFIRMSNNLGAYNYRCLVSRRGALRRRCVLISGQTAFTMSGLAQALVGKLNIHFRTRFSNFAFSLWRMTRGGSLFINSATSRRLRGAINLFTNFGIAKNVFLGFSTYNYILGAMSWLVAAANPTTPSDDVIIGAIASTQRRLLAVSADVAATIADLDKAQLALATDMTVGETRTATRENTFLSVFRTTIAGVASSYLIGPDATNSWTVTKQSNWNVAYAGSDAAAASVIVDYRARIYPKGFNPRAGAGTIQPHSAVLSLNLRSVSGTLLDGATNTIRITLPAIITSVDGQPVPEFAGSADMIQPECYRWNSKVNNWVSAKGNSALECVADINADAGSFQDFALIVPPPFVRSTLRCPVAVLPNEAFTCTMTPIKNGVTREARIGTFEVVASGHTIVNAPTGIATASAYPMAFRASATESSASSITVSTMTAYIENMPTLVPISAYPVNGSVLTCTRLIIQSGCPSAAELAATNRSSCSSVPAMRVDCTIAVKDNSSATSSACLAGTTCRGTTAGTFQVEVSTPSRVISNNVTYTYNGGSTPTATGTVLTALAGDGSALADGSYSSMSFSVTAPYVTETMSIKVKILGTTTFVRTKFGGTSWPLTIRDSAPDASSTITCAALSSYPRFNSVGQILAMPMSLSTRVAAAYSSNPNIPAAAVCSGNCLSVVRCTVTPRQSGRTLSGFAYDFDPQVTSTTTGQTSDVIVGSVTGTLTGGSTCDCSAFTPENIVQCTCAASSYYFDITARSNTIKETNPHQFKISANGVEITNFTHTFQVNYAQMQSNFQTEIGCEPSNGATAANFAVSGRTVTCKGLVKDSTGVPQPVAVTCLGANSVTTSNNKHFSSFGTFTTIDGVGFTFQATPNEVGNCAGAGASTCSYNLITVPSGGASCGVAAYTYNDLSVTVQHGTPTVATTMTCTTPSGMSKDNIRTSGTTTCTISPSDAFGPITCCSPALTTMSVTATSGSVGVFSTTNNGRSITFTLAAPVSIPTGNVYGQLTLSLAFGGTALGTQNMYVVSYPTEHSTVVCTPTQVATLQSVRCVIVPKNAAGNITADPNDFYLVPIDAATFGKFSQVTAIEAARTFTSRLNSEFQFTMTAGKVRGTGKNITVKSTFHSTASSTQITNTTTLLEDKYTLSSGGIPISIVYGSATAASTLSCSGANIVALGSQTCTIAVKNALGSTTVDPASPPFAVTSSTGSTLSAVTSADAGETFTFTSTAGDSLLLNNLVNLTAMISSVHVSGSPAQLKVVYEPTIASTLACTPTSLKGLGIATCTISPKMAGGASTKASVADFTVVPSAGAVSNFTIGANDNTVTFSYAAPAVTASTTASLALSVRGAAATPLSVTVVPGVPTSKSTVSCVSALGSSSVEIRRTATCTITAFDDAGRTSASIGAFSVAAPSAGAVSTLTTVDGGQTFTFTYTASVTTLPPLNVQILVSIAGGASLSPVSLAVIYGTPVVANSRLVCTPTNVAGSGVAQCTITFADATGATTAAPTAFSVSTSVGTLSAPTTADQGQTYTFTFTADGGVIPATITARLGATIFGTATITINGTPVPTLPTCTVSLSVFTPAPLSTTSPVILQATQMYATATNVKYQWTVTGHPTANGVSTSTSPFLTVAATASASTVKVTVVLSFDNYNNCSATVSYSTIAAPSAGILQTSKTSVTAGGTDTVDLKCTNWVVGANPIVTYTFYMNDEVIAQQAADTLTYTPAYRAADAIGSFTCSAINNVGMESFKSQAASIELRKTVIVVGQESSYVSNILSQVPSLPAGTSTTSPAYTAAISAIANAAAAINNVAGLSAADKAAKIAELSNKMKNVVSLGALSSANKEQFTSLSAGLAANVDTTSTTALNDLYAVMQSATKAPLSSKAATSANNYANTILNRFGTTAAHNFRSLAVSEAQDTATSQAINVLATATQGYLFANNVLPGTTVSVSGSTYYLYGSVNAPSALNVNFNASVSFTISSSSLSSIGYVRIKFSKNLRSYASANLVAGTNVEGFALFTATSFLADNVAVSYSGSANGDVHTWMKNATGRQVGDGWSKCTTCALNTNFAPSEYAYIATASSTTAPVTPSPTPTPTVQSTSASTPAPTDTSSSSKAWIAAPVIGGVALIALIIGGICYCNRKKKEEGGESGQRVGEDSAELENEHRV